MAKKKIIKKLRNKYRLIIYNDRTFAETFSLRLSLFNTYAIVGSLAILFMIIGILLVMFTPVRNLFPNSEYKIARNLRTNAILIDSIENRMHLQQQHYDRIVRVLNGTDTIVATDTVNPQGTFSDSSSSEISYNRSSADSVLRKQIEEQERFNITKGQKSVKDHFINFYLFPPLSNGIIIAAHQMTGTNHYGIDIAAPANSHIMAALEGTVISSGWSVDNGYTIVLQHPDNLISCYKHNSELLKSEGDVVKKGEAIAIIGNTGENSSGPHLHFELWYKGQSINPEDYISF